jgi:hypothetical protein
MQTVESHYCWHERDGVVEHPIGAEHKKTHVPFGINNGRGAGTKKSPHDGFLLWKHVHMYFVPVKQKQFTLHCFAQEDV